MPWAYIKKLLQELFHDSLTRIILCNNRVTIPEPFDRNKIILENLSMLRPLEAIRV
jgi:hypothetical protein